MNCNVCFVVLVVLCSICCSYVNTYKKCKNLLSHKIQQMLKAKKITRTLVFQTTFFYRKKTTHPVQKHNTHLFFLLIIDRPGVAGAVL